MHDLPAKALSLWANIRNYVTVGLAGVVLVTGGMYYVTKLRLEACEANTSALVARYEAAQTEAELLAEQNTNRIEQEYRERAEETDRELASLLARYNSSLVRYANRSEARATAPAPTGGGTEGSDRPSEDPVVSDNLILIPYSDAEICAENTARLQVVRDWALSLNEVE